MKQKERLKIGFVILTWNSERVIGKCLDSIDELRKIDPAVVIIDNGSSDGTIRVIASRIEQHPDRYRLIRNSSNEGTTVPRNTGLRELERTVQDYYCILDSDTEVSDEALLMLAEELEKHPEYGLIGPQMHAPSGHKQISARRFPTLSEKLCKAVPVTFFQKKGEDAEKQNPPYPGALSYPVDYVVSACWLMRTELTKNAGYFDEKIFYGGEDAEYCIRVWKSGYQVAYCPESVILHEWQRLSKQKLISRINWEHLKGLSYLFLKHRYFRSTAKLRIPDPQCKTSRHYSLKKE